MLCEALCSLCLGGYKLNCEIQKQKILSIIMASRRCRKNILCVYLFSVDTKSLFSTGKNTRADSVVVVWADKKQVLQNLNADSTYTLNQKIANEIATIFKQTYPCCN
jgi:hypothetical protein